VSRPSLDDPVVGALSEGVGGPVGSHAGRHPWWTPLRVLLALTAVVIAVGMAQKASCAGEDWRGENRYTSMCYTDLAFLYVGRGLAEGEWPYTSDPQVRARHQVMEYPVGIAYGAWAMAQATRGLAGSGDLEVRGQVPVADLYAQESVTRETRLFVALHAVVFAALILLSVWLLAAVHPQRPWDASAFALAPPLALTFLINWDMFSVVLVAAALAAWSRDRPGLTGVLIGLGAATKLYPLFLLGGIVVICLRQRRWRDLVASTGAAVAAWVLANAPAYLTGADQWRVFWSFNSDRGADLGSLWLVAAQAGDLSISADTINHWSWAVFLIWCGLVALVGLRAPSTPRLAQLAFLVVAGFLIVNKVYSPQYVLWLLPLAVLARPRWRDQIVWQATEVFYFASVWWYLAGDLAATGLDDAPVYWVAILVRVAGQLYLCAVVGRDIWWPRHDPVRAVEAVPQSMTTRSNVVAV
jgi:uncharacterized membrane protein